MGTMTANTDGRWKTTVGGAALLVAGAGLLWHQTRRGTRARGASNGGRQEELLSINRPVSVLQEAWPRLEGRSRILPQDGGVRFIAEPGDRGTTVVVDVRRFARRSKVREALRHFKQMMEAGECPSIEGQPRGAR